MDRDKHYWADEEEVEKLLRHGAGWLAEHPDDDNDQSATRAAFEVLHYIAVKRLYVFL